MPIGAMIDVATALGSLGASAMGKTDLAGRINTAGTVASATVNDTTYAVKSIAEKARKSVMMYKVMVSSSVRDVDIASKIGKYLENMYAIFTMLVLGYNPMADNNEGIGKIIDSVSAESMHPGTFNFDTQKLALIEAMNSVDSSRDFGNKHPRIGRNASKSEEANSNIDGNDISSFVAKGIKKMLDEDKDKGSNLKTNELKFINDVQRNTSTAYPTIVNMNVTTGPNKSDMIAIPIAVKCNIYPIGTEETRLFIESNLSGKMSDFLRKVKWRSGEISTLAFIFNTDIAKQNRKLYDKLGRNPMFMELQQRKNAAKTSFWGKFLTRFSSAVNDEYAKDSDPDFKKEMKTINQSFANCPPTASLIVSIEDMVAATRLNPEHFTKNEGFINRFMKDSFLLCLGLVDHSAEKVTFFFMGYKNPFILSFNDLKKQGEDENKDLYASIKELARKV